ncbi:E3 ubiquitin-protein ligase TRIM21-like [Convolutriloba macropyga]|uniref:E3 ubiquitin-protein ligase TRIM21-like n=1 Tax=Convolutriloba macropyga TaxID=536237 RepID=UPI003F526EBC
MNSLIKLSTKSPTVLDCPICSEILLDPRVLPCGHSFCGPPRSCLDGIKRTDPDTVKCAVCNQSFALKLDDLKPLYGIRDALQELNESSKFSSMKDDSLSESNCTAHGGKFTLWCKDCSQELCSVCFEEIHIEHSVKNFKTVLKKRAAEMLDRIAKSKIQMSIRLLPEIKICQDEIAKLTEELQLKKDLCSNLCDKKRFLEHFIGMEKELQKYIRGELVDPDVIISYLKEGERKFSDTELEDKKLAKFTLTISNIKSLKKAMKSSDEIPYEGFGISIEAYYKPCELKKQPALELYLKVANDAKNADSDHWQLKLQFWLTLENLEDKSKNVSWTSNYTFSEKGTKQGCEIIEWDRLFSRGGFLNGNGVLTLNLQLAKLN